MIHGQALARLRGGLLVAATLCGLTFGVSLTLAQSTTTIYLDFDGHYEVDYSLYDLVQVPPFEGSTADQEEIRRRIEEDFAPFDVVVTRLEPANVEEGYAYEPSSRRVVRVAIGGSPDDLNNRSQITDLDTGTIFFAEIDRMGVVIENDRIATGVSRELAWRFSWEVLRLFPWSPDFFAHSLVDYRAAPGPLHVPRHDLSAMAKTQIFGGPQDPTHRTIWWRDSDVVKGRNIFGDGEPVRDWQDDILTLAGVLGRRADDHGDTPTSASTLDVELSVNGPRLIASGIVEDNRESFTGMCPPTPIWRHCGGESAGEFERAPREYVFLPLQKDFFRFDVTSINGFGTSRPELEVSVTTLTEKLVDDYGPGTFPNGGNLDAELEIWFNDPVWGWTDVSVRGARRDIAIDTWATWVADGSGLLTGEYAVAVKSAGAYGDLGAYDLSVSGRGGVSVSRVDGVAGNGLRARGDAAHELIGRLRELSDRHGVIELLVAMSQLGAEEALERGDVSQETHSSSWADAKAVIEGALAQTSALELIGAFVDWSTVDEPDRLYEELADVVEGLGFDEPVH